MEICLLLVIFVLKIHYLRIINTLDPSFAMLYLKDPFQYCKQSGLI